VFPYRVASFAIAFTLATAGAAAPPRESGPIEVIDLPAGRDDGMLYIDEETAPVARKADELLDQILSGSGEAGQDLLRPASPLYTALRRGLVRYRQKWGDLPQVEIPAGPTLRVGQEGPRVELLRRRLGLAAGTKFDKALAAAVREYKDAHGLSPDSLAGAETIASLNLGAAHYERLVAINLERTRSLPVGDRQRYILVDAAAARLWMYENGEVKGTMKVIVGTAASKTPMMAAMIRYADVNPYWNVPPDLTQKRIAPRVISEGLPYLKGERYEVLSDWTDDAVPVDPAGVDWKAVVDGSEVLRVRQLPGVANSMGDIKFMMPNDYGIYLHDTPDKALFEKNDRWLSNGCVRVEDARRLAAWLFGKMPEGQSRDVEERVDLDEPVPVYITYLTAAPADKGGGIAFRADPYERDAPVLARLKASSPIMDTASRD
jgi:murein L,D-transpeptidase YcbB/YkuD